MAAIANHTLLTLLCMSHVAVIGEIHKDVDKITTCGSIYSTGGVAIIYFSHTTQ